MFRYLTELAEVNMTTLKLNDIEWESLGSVVSVRYMEFLKEHLSESKEFFYMGETKEEIKAEIMSFT